MNRDKPLPAFAGRMHGEILRGQDCGYGQAPVLTEGAFNQLALELFDYQFSANAVYRRFCELRGARPGALDDWRDIPAMPTEGFKEHELTCLPAADRTTVFYSSGTTGQQPSRHYHSKVSLGSTSVPCGPGLPGTSCPLPAYSRNGCWSWRLPVWMRLTRRWRTCLAALQHV